MARQDQWEAGLWHIEKGRWTLLWTGTDTKRRTFTRDSKVNGGSLFVRDGKPFKDLTVNKPAAQEGGCTQNLQILLLGGTAGIDERTRGITQRWFKMLYWRSARVGSALAEVKWSTESKNGRLGGELNRRHSQRAWVERQERKSI